MGRRLRAMARAARKRGERRERAAFVFVFVEGGRRCTLGAFVRDESRPDCEGIVREHVDGREDVVLVEWETGEREWRHAAIVDVDVHRVAG